MSETVAFSHRIFSQLAPGSSMMQVATCKRPFFFSSFLFPLYTAAFWTASNYHLNPCLSDSVSNLWATWSNVSLPLRAVTVTVDLQTLGGTE